jgi:hypothetical protein
MGVATTIAAIGLGISAYGAYSGYTASKGAAKASAAAALSQSEIAKLQAAGVDTDIEKLGLQSEQARLQIRTQKAVIGLQQQAEGIRLKASQLDATRRRRELIRQSIIANSNSLAVMTAQGANKSGSTARAQASSDISGRTGVNLLGVSQNLEFGKKLFDVNNSISNLYLQAQTDNQSFVDSSEFLQQKAFATQKKIYALGGEASKSYAEAASFGGTAALGSGLSSLGGALMSHSTTIGKIGTYFTSPSGGPTILPSYSAPSSVGSYFKSSGPTGSIY